MLQIHRPHLMPARSHLTLYSSTFPKAPKSFSAQAQGQYKLRSLYPIPEIWCLDADRQRTCIRTTITIINGIANHLSAMEVWCGLIPNLVAQNRDGSSTVRNRRDSVSASFSTSESLANTSTNTRRRGPQTPSAHHPQIQAHHSPDQQSPSPYPCQCRHSHPSVCK